MTTGPSLGDLIPRQVASPDMARNTSVPNVWYLWKINSQYTMSEIEEGEEIMYLQVGNG